MTLIKKKLKNVRLTAFFLLLLHRYFFNNYINY